jgi:cell division protein ZapA
MAQVSVTIKGRQYTIACDDGQEEHLRELAATVDQRVSDLIAQVGDLGDLRMVVMASLLVADELAETRSALAERGDEASAPGAGAEADSAEIIELADVVEQASSRIERLAAALEGA